MAEKTLEDIPGVGPAIAEKLREAGYTEIMAIAVAAPSDLAETCEIGEKKAQDIIDSLSNDSRESFCVFTKGIGRDAMREIANKAVLLTDGAAGIFGEEAQGFSYIIASSSLPLRAKSKEINQALGGKGGGSDQMIQGSVTASKEDIEAFFKTI